MADKWGKNLGVNKSSRNPTAIANLEHDDKSLSSRNQSGTPGTYNSIISNAATAQVVPDYAVLRVCNTTGTVQYLFIGALADVPGGAPTIANGIAIPPNFTENVYLGKLEDPIQSIHIKASDNGVQIAICEL